MASAIKKTLLKGKKLNCALSQKMKNRPERTKTTEKEIFVLFIFKNPKISEDVQSFPGKQFFSQYFTEEMLVFVTFNSLYFLNTFIDLFTFNNYAILL